jgi:uncharacterized protein DUF2442
MARRFPSRIAVPPMTDAMYRSAVKSAKQDEPLDVTVARYDRRADTIDLTLRKGVTVRLPRLQIRELTNATPADVSRIDIQPGGDGISFRKINVDIYVPGLLADELGPLFAKAIGRRSRGRTSEKKAASSRENGRKGGRPKKTAA